MSSTSQVSFQTDQHFRLGNRAYDSRDFAVASRHYAAVVALQPRNDKAWINLGLSLLHAGRPAQARDALEKAVALCPGQIKPLALLAASMQRSRAKDAEQIPVLRRALALAPQAVDMRLQLASSLFGIGEYGQAHVELLKVVAQDPANLNARWLGMQMPEAAISSDERAREAFLRRWRDGLEWFEKIDWRDMRYARQAESTLSATTHFYLAYLGRPLLAEHERYGALLHTMAKTAYPSGIETLPRTIGKKRRKLAIFSASLHAHSVSRVWSSTLLKLPAADFEIAAFHPCAIEDASTARWRAHASRFENGDRPVSVWIETLRKFAPDIVLFPDIGMDRVTQAVASLRHAPVQIAAWGHPVTSGLPTIDYFLSVDAAEPANAAEHYSERLVRLPRLGSFLEPRAAPAMRDRSDGQIRFLCTQSGDKLHPAHDDLFAAVLKAAPDARLDLLCGTDSPQIAAALADRLRAAFARNRLDFDARCNVHSRLPVEEYYRFLANTDVCLDSLDFSGGITSLDTLWHGVPIVTLPGALMRGRQTYAMLKLLQLDELIANDAADYVCIATRLAHDASWRAQMADRIRTRKPELYEDQSAVDALAKFLRTVEPDPA